jgi:hypothetical protein
LRCVCIGVHEIQGGINLGQMLFELAPEYRVAVERGRDVRYLWFALRDWSGGNAEEFFGGLGEWAERRLAELGVEGV